MLEVSRSGFYAWLARVPSERSRRDAELLVLIRQVYVEGRGAYGAPRVHRVLQNRGVRCGRKRVARLMAENGMAGKVRRPFRPQTTNSDHDGPIAPNLVEQNFRPDEPNTVWASDITYIATGEGWLYLATTIDLYSRRVVGWSMSDSLETKLPLDALRAAIADRLPAPGVALQAQRHDGSVPVARSVTGGSASIGHRSHASGNLGVRGSAPGNASLPARRGPRGRH